MTKGVDSKAIAILFGPPLVAGIMVGANQARAGVYLSWSLSIAYWITLALVTWLTLAIATTLMRRLLQPWHPPVAAVWLGGGIVGSIAARPIIYAIAEAFRPFMQAPALRSMPPIELSADFLSYYVTNWAAILILWTAACWVERAWRSSAGAAPAAPAPSTATTLSPAPRPTGIMRRLPPALGRDVLALQSEDHYVRVFTAIGDTLMLTSISDAIDDVEQSGIAGQRVHRSWWVANGAVAESVASGRRQIVRLVNGVEAPVSQTYRALARQAGVLR